MADERTNPGNLSRFQVSEMAVVENHLIDADDKLLDMETTNWHREQYAMFRELQHTLTRARQLAGLLYKNELKG